MKESIAEVLLIVGGIGMAVFAYLFVASLLADLIDPNNDLTKFFTIIFLWVPLFLITGLILYFV